MKLIEFPGPQTWKTKYVQNNVVNEPTLTIFATAMHKGFPYKETAKKLFLKAAPKPVS